VTGAAAVPGFGYDDGLMEVETQVTPISGATKQTSPYIIEGGMVRYKDPRGLNGWTAWVPQNAKPNPGTVAYSDRAKGKVLVTA
jgi:hypothetical protein